MGRWARSWLVLEAIIYTANVLRISAVPCIGHDGRTKRTSVEQMAIIIYEFLVTNTLNLGVQNKDIVSSQLVTCSVC